MCGDSHVPPVGTWSRDSTTLAPLRRQRFDDVRVMDDRAEGAERTALFKLGLDETNSAADTAAETKHVGLHDLAHVGSCFLLGALCTLPFCRCRRSRQSRAIRRISPASRLSGTEAATTPPAT